MNYLIWKGVNSSTITGLVICELPPITKPKMKVSETHIDGVDGSIYEELGYQSYDKTVKIGLKGNFDINEVIDYFSGEGQITFSNEPDKYYKAKIIDNIDFDRLLRFRTANVKFRVQPFKYDANDTLTGYPLRKSYDAYQKINASTTQTVHGLTFTPNGDGTVTITGTPEINNIIGVYSYNAIAGHKYALLFNSESGKWSTWYQNWDERWSTLRNEYIIDEYDSSGAKSVGLVFLPLEPLNITIGFQAIDLTAMFGAGNEPTGSDVKREVLKGNTVISMNQINSNNQNSYTYKGVTFTNNGDGSWTLYGRRTESYCFKNIRYAAGEFFFIEGHKYYLSAKSSLGNNLYLRAYRGSTKISTDKQPEQICVATGKEGTYDILRIMLESSKPLNNVTVYPMCIDLTQMFGSGNEPQTVEEVKSYIPEEYFYAQPIDSYDWTAGSVVNYIDNVYGKYHQCVNRVDLGSLTWTKVNGGTNRFLSSGIASSVAIPSSGSEIANIALDGYTTVSFSTAHSESVDKSIAITYIIPETHGSINIVDTQYSTAQELKEALSGKYLYYELATETVTDIKDFIVINSGNHTSKPTIRIYGSGTISVKLNGITQFTYTFPSGDTYVDIDCDKQDAYVGSTLKNRNMTGVFPALNSGSNIISWTGTITQMQFSNYSRWL